MQKHLSGVIVGLVLIAGAWWLYNYAGNAQQRAAAFGEAQEIEATQEGVSGFVAATGTATAIESQALSCPDGSGRNCLYVNTVEEEYTMREANVCGELGAGTVVIRQTSDQCDDLGCEPCYDVEEYEWETENTDDQYAPFAFGNYTVRPSSRLNNYDTDTVTSYQGARTEDNPIVGDRRLRYTYMPVSSVKLVAGMAKNNEITFTGEKTEVISTGSYAAVMADFEKQDSSTKWLLRIVALVIGVAGVSMLGRGAKKAMAGGTAMVKDASNRIGGNKE